MLVAEGKGEVKNLEEKGAGGEVGKQRGSKQKGSLMLQFDIASG